MACQTNEIRCGAVPKPVSSVLIVVIRHHPHSSNSILPFDCHHSVRPHYTRRDHDHLSTYFFNDCWSFVVRAFLVVANSSDVAVAVVSASFPSFFRSNSMKENTPVPLYLSPWPKPNRTRSKVDFMDQKTTIFTSVLRAMLRLLVRAKFLPINFAGKKAVADRSMTKQNSNTIVRMLKNSQYCEPKGAEMTKEQRRNDVDFGGT